MSDLFDLLRCPNISQTRPGGEAGNDDVLESVVAEVKGHQVGHGGEGHLGQRLQAVVGQVQLRQPGQIPEVVLADVLDQVVAGGQKQILTRKSVINFL